MIVSEQCLRGKVCGVIPDLAVEAFACDSLRLMSIVSATHWRALRKRRGDMANSSTLCDTSASILDAQVSDVSILVAEREQQSGDTV